MYFMVPLMTRCQQAMSHSLNTSPETSKEISRLTSHFIKPPSYSRIPPSWVIVMFQTHSGRHPHAIISGPISVPLLKMFKTKSIQKRNITFTSWLDITEAIRFLNTLLLMLLRMLESLGSPTMHHLLTVHRLYLPASIIEKN